MNAGPQTDERLLAAHARGDPQAMDRLLSRHREKLRRFLAWRTEADAADVEDLVQEVCLQALRSSGGFEGRSRFRTWLYGVAENVGRTWIRGRVRQRRVLVDAGGEEMEQVAETEPHRGPDALTILETAETHRHVRVAVDRLAPEQRQVLLLVDWEELSYAEIGTVLDIPVGTVKSRVHHARLNLARTLKDVREGR